MTETKNPEPHGNALVVVHKGKAMCLAWQATFEIATLVKESLWGGASIEQFDMEDGSFDIELTDDGVFVCDITMVDDGPGDSPGTREVVAGFVNMRPATEEEWAHHRHGEWPWEPLDENEPSQEELDAAEAEAKKGLEDFESILERNDP